VEFGETRKGALAIWLEGSGRGLSERGYDEFAGAFECNWQLRADDLGKPHISFFCSLGAFSGHLTDLLTDERFDRLIYGQDEEVDEVLFRFFSRVLLVGSEILDDFRKIRKMLFKGHPSLLSEAADKLISITNNAVKHKIKMVHNCSHIQISFEDDPDPQPLSLPAITNQGMLIGSDENSAAIFQSFMVFKKTEQPIQAILVPSLSFIIDTILQCYRALDSIIGDDSNFNLLCEAYEEA